MLWTDTICSNHLTKCLCLLYNCYNESLIAAGFKVSWDTILSIISDVFFLVGCKLFQYMFYIIIMYSYEKIYIALSCPIK